MPFYLVGLFIIVYALLKDFKRAFQMYLCFHMVLVQNITVLSIPGLPLLTLDMALSLFFLVCYFYHGTRFQTAHLPYPYRKPALLLILCVSISAFFSIQGIAGELSAWIKALLEGVFLPWMVWQSIDEEVDFRFVIKCMTIIIFCTCIYGLIEFLLKSNPLVVYERTLNHDPSKVINNTYGTAARGYRVQSVFEHAIGAGINWAMYASFICTLYVYRRDIPVRKIAFATVFLCIPCLILTKMRASLFFFAFAMLGIVRFRRKRFYNVAMLLIVAVVLISPILVANIDILLSFVSSSAQKAVGGSDSNMRFNQLKAAVSLFMDSPVWGLGISFKETMDTVEVRALLGSESVWFHVIPAYGLIGIVTYLVLIYYEAYKIPKVFRSMPMRWLAIAYWLTFTLTSVPGMIELMYYFMMFYYIKTSSVYKKAAEKGNGYGFYIKSAKLHYNRIH